MHISKSYIFTSEIYTFLYFTAKRQNCKSNISHQNVRVASLLQ